MVPGGLLLLLLLAPAALFDSGARGGNDLRRSGRNFEAPLLSARDADVAAKSI